MEPTRTASLEKLLEGRFNWTVGPPLVSPLYRPSDPCHAVKDPTIVRYKNRWHLFCTIRSQIRSHQIEYLSFADFRDANKAERHVLTVRDGYLAAPQVFYFRPHKKWYLIYQVGEPKHRLEHHVGYSTTDDIANPASWTKTQLLFPDKDPRIEAGLDFWIICDEEKAYLFYTSLNGKMWRLWTHLGDFPAGFDHPELALQADIFEASHTYRLKGQGKFLTVIEAQADDWLDKLLTVMKVQAGGRRYYKAYLADRLDGGWAPLAATKYKPFVSPTNVRDKGVHWTDSFSHGELLRDGYDEKLEVDPANLRFLFQGVSDQARAGKKYSEIPWQLGLLDAIS